MALDRSAVEHHRAHLEAVALGDAEEVDGVSRRGAAGGSCGIAAVHQGPGREGAGHALVVTAGELTCAARSAGQAGVGIRWIQPGA